MFLLHRNRILILVGLGLLALLSWIYLFYRAWEMQHMSMGMALSMPQMQVWSGLDFGLTLLMWVIMMVGMMVPSAAPMILAYDKVVRNQTSGSEPLIRTGLFLSGYLAVWTGFSLLATLLQWGLHSSALLSPMMVSTSPVLGGLLLIAAGIFQWSPLKYACLGHCRLPLSFFMTEWRPGRKGALQMGVRHGAFCTGCCWALMLLLFVLGVMNLVWIAVLAVIVLAEKVLPAGARFAQVLGVVFVVWGLYLVAGGLL